MKTVILTTIALIAIVTICGFYNMIKQTNEINEEGTNNGN